MSGDGVSRLRAGRKGTGRYDLLIAVAAVVFYAAAFAHSLLAVVEPAGTPPADIWIPQLFALVVFSILLVPAALLAKKAVFRFVWLLPQIAMVAILSIPSGSNLWPETWAVLALLAQASFLLPMTIGIPISLGVIALITSLQGDVIAWHVSIPGPDREAVVSLALLWIVVATLFYLLRILSVKYSSVRHQVGDLTSIANRLVEANLDFQQYAADMDTYSTIRERQRITRELHDLIGYALTNLVMMMEAGKDLAATDPDRLEHLLSRAHEQAKDALIETRATLRALRANTPTITSRSRLKKLVDTYRNATGVEVAVELTNLPTDLDERVDQVVYRVVQEGLTNAFRHGKASQVTVLIQEQQGWLSVSILDNGKGADKVVDGIGMEGLKERILPMGGSVQAVTLPNGFKLSCTVPLEESKDGAKDTRLAR